MEASPGLVLNKQRPSTCPPASFIICQRKPDILQCAIECCPPVQRLLDMSALQRDLANNTVTLATVLAAQFSAEMASNARSGAGFGANGSDMFGVIRVALENKHL